MYENWGAAVFKSNISKYLSQIFFYLTGNRRMAFQTPYGRNKSKDVFDAVETNDLNCMQRLDASGLIRGYTEYRNVSTNRTPLMEAVRSGRCFEMIHILLMNGANPFATTDKKGILHFPLKITLKQPV